MVSQVDVCICHNLEDPTVLENFQDKLISYGFRILLLEINDAQNDIASVDMRTILLIVSDKPHHVWQYPNMVEQLEKQASQGVNISIVLIPGSEANFQLPPFLQRVPIINIAENNRVNWHRFFIEIMEVSKVLETSRSIVTNGASVQRSSFTNQELDVIGIAAVKSQLHALSEIVAKDASQSAAQAAQTYPYDALTMLIPLIIELRWRRGYRTALERILSIPEPKQYLRDFKIEEPNPPCRVDQGILSAQRENDTSVTIFLGNFPAAIVNKLNDEEAQLIVETINDYGRLPRAKTGELSLIDRIRLIPLRSMPESKDEIAMALYRNRDILLPLISRYRIPGVEWLSDDEKYLEQRREWIKSSGGEIREGDTPRLPQFMTEREETFEAEHPYRPQPKGFEQLFRERPLGGKKKGS